MTHDSVAGSDGGYFGLESERTRVPLQIPAEIQAIEKQQAHDIVPARESQSIRAK